VARNFWSKRGQTQLPAELAPDTDQFNPEKGQRDSEFRKELKEYLVRLTPREREIFLLRDIEECSIKETAGILGCSSVSVRVHLVSARHKIKDAVLERNRALQDKER
jgi:RNA polymerase sigma-70 factor (ECF subfamily)